MGEVRNRAGKSYMYEISTIFESSRCPILTSPMIPSKNIDKDVRERWWSIMKDARMPARSLAWSVEAKATKTLNSRCSSC